VGVDGSTHSVTALSYANQLARTLGLPLHAVLAWDYPPPLYQDLAYPQVRTSVRAHAGERLRDAIDAVLDGDEPPWLTYDARQGAPAATLLALSRYARLLVVGTRGTVASPIFSSDPSARHACRTPPVPLLWSRGRGVSSRRQADA